MLERGSVLVITLALLKPCRSMLDSLHPGEDSCGVSPVTGWPGKGLLRGHHYPAEVECVLTARCWCGHECLWPCHLQGKTSPIEWEIPCPVLLSFCCPSLPPHPDCIPAA